MPNKIEVCFDEAKMKQKYNRMLILLKVAFKIYSVQQLSLPNGYCGIINDNKEI